VKAKEVPGMHKALVAISPYFRMFYSAFEASSDHGKAYFEQESDPFDLHLHAHLVRFKVQRFLDQHALKSEVDPEDLTNGGIQLTIADWFIRIKKSSRGALPSPGRSWKTKNYYQQTWPGECGEMHNLLLLWHATSQGEFRGLSLVYPWSGIEKWRYDIPHPAVSAGRSTYQAEFDVDGNVEEVGDLEIVALTDNEDNEEDSEAENQ
jgi:hypothetical protein